MFRQNTKVFLTQYFEGSTSSFTTSSEILPPIAYLAPATLSPSAINNFTLIPSFDKLNNLTKENMQQLLNILQSNSDITACLANCSNHGICKIDNRTYVCECNEYFMGKSCQTDKRPCSQSNKCLNNGTCVNSQDLASSSCQCPQNSLFYGQFCENMRNLCKNVTCSSHGHCIQSQNSSFVTQCKCYTGYTGDNCESDSSKVKLVRNIQWLSTAICIVTLVTLWLSFISSDVLDFLKIGHEHIDMKKWRREKMFGEDRRESQKAKARLVKQKFVYVQQKPQQ